MQRKVSRGNSRPKALTAEFQKPVCWAATLQRQVLKAAGFRPRRGIHRPGTGNGSANVDEGNLRVKAAVALPMNWLKVTAMTLGFHCPTGSPVSVYVSLPGFTWLKLVLIFPKWSKIT